MSGFWRKMEFLTLRVIGKYLFESFYQIGAGTFEWIPALYGEDN